MIVSQEERELRDSVWPSAKNIIAKVHPSVDLSGDTESALRTVLGIGVSMGILYGETDITQLPQARYDQMWDKLVARDGGQKQQ